MPAPPPPSAAERWAPWAIGAVVCAAYAVLAPVVIGGDGAVWRAIAWVADALPFGEPAERVHGAAAVCAGGAAALVARIGILAGGGAAAAIDPTGETPAPPAKPAGSPPPAIAGAICGAIAGAAVMVAAGRWDAGAAVAGPDALLVALVLGAVVLAEAIATGGGAWPGIGGGVLAGLAIAADGAALVVAPVIVAVWAIRWRYGARWAVAAPIAALAAWTVAMIPVWRAGIEPTVVHAPSATYAIDLADTVGAPAAVAGAAGLVILVARRRTRWIGAFAVALVGGGVAVDRWRDAALGPLPVAGLALAAGIGVARLARLAGPPVGQACVGGAAAVIVATPAVLAAF
jgi:hypothetical protein